MAKLGKDKIALFLACASIFGGNTRAAQDVKTGQTIGAVGGAAFNSQSNSGVRVKDSFGNQKFGTKEKLIAAGTILASLGIGAAGGYAVRNALDASAYSKGKEYFIKSFQNFKPKFINFGAKRCFAAFNEKGFICVNALEVAKLLYPELEGEKINKKALEIDDSLEAFFTKYNQNLRKKYIEIASRHKFCVFGVCVFGEESEGYTDVSDLIIHVVPEGEKLTVRILQLSNDKKGMLNDVTEDFIAKEENGKAFVDDLVEFVNSDDFMKQVLLGGKDEKAEGEKMAKKMKTK